MSRSHIEQTYAEFELWKLTGEYKQWYAETLDIQDGKCYYCHYPLTMRVNIDHAIPVSKGGTNRIENLVLACWLCNKAKGSRIIERWRCPDILELSNGKTWVQLDTGYVRLNYTPDYNTDERSFFIGLDQIDELVEVLQRAKAMMQEKRL